jgi:phosphatidylserine decarboxylase
MKWLLQPRVWVPITAGIVLVIAALVYLSVLWGPRVELQIIISSMLIALLFLGVQSLYWGIHFKVWIPAAVLVGVVTAAVMHGITSWRPNLGLVPMLLLECVFIEVIAAVALLTYFFRDPPRSSTEREGVVLSPADGKIIYVKRVNDESQIVSVKAGTRFPLDELLHTQWPFKGGYLVGILMNVMDVHVNRSPIEGKVVFRKHIGGKFIGLGKPNTEVRSERFTTIIENGKITVAVVQIASRFVRRIVSYVKDLQPIHLGQRIGMIRFGSQVDIVIPNAENLQIVAEPNATVRAGVTIIARYG